MSLVTGKGDSGAAGGTFDDAIDDAGDLLVGTAGVLIRVLALALPLGAARAGRVARHDRVPAPPARVRARLSR